MNKEDYQKYLSKFLREYKVLNVLIQPNLVRVDMIPQEKNWGKCTFIFTEDRIICFGDVESYIWRTTWNAAEGIKNGKCNADNFSYLTEKLEHSQELKEFEFSDEVMDEIKKDIIECYGLEGKELEEFNEKWEDNYYHLYDVEKYRLNGLDEFFEEMEIDDYYEYYSKFEHLPAHYYLAVAMLRCIEDYFSKLNK